MISSPNEPCSDIDYFSEADLIPCLEPAQIDALRQRARLTGLDGSPCWSADEVEDILGDEGGAA